MKQLLIYIMTAITTQMPTPEAFRKNLLSLALMLVMAFLVTVTLQKIAQMLLPELIPETGILPEMMLETPWASPGEIPGKKEKTSLIRRLAGKLGKILKEKPLEEQKGKTGIFPVRISRKLLSLIRRYLMR